MSGARRRPLPGGRPSAIRESCRKAATGLFAPILPSPPARPLSTIPITDRELGRRIRPIRDGKIKAAPPAHLPAGVASVCLHIGFGDGTRWLSPQRPPRTHLTRRSRRKEIAYHGLQERTPAHARRRISAKSICVWNAQFCNEVARSERFELPTLGIEIRCSIQLSYERVRRVDYQTWPGRASSGMSVAGMPPAVLADIGGRALAAEDGGGAVVIGEGAGLQAGAVIVQVADRVGQAPIVQVMTIVAGIGQTRGQGRGGQAGRRQSKTSLCSCRFSGSPVWNYSDFELGG